MHIEIIQALWSYSMNKVIAIDEINHLNYPIDPSNIVELLDVFQCALVKAVLKRINDDLSEQPNLPLGLKKLKLEI